MPNLCGLNFNLSVIRFQNQEQRFLNAYGMTTREVKNAISETAAETMKRIEAYKNIELPEALQDIILSPEEENAIREAAKNTQIALDLKHEVNNQSGFKR